MLKWWVKNIRLFSSILCWKVLHYVMRKHDLLFINPCYLLPITFLSVICLEIISRIIGSITFCDGDQMWVWLDCSSLKPPSCPSWRSEWKQFSSLLQVSPPISRMFQRLLSVILQWHQPVPSALLGASQQAPIDLCSSSSFKSSLT